MLAGRGRGNGGGTGAAGRLFAELNTGRGHATKGAVEVNDYELS
jgi:hypothetical protein